jgi:EmrB/QacA subfamily drug resistance transporter
VTDQQQGLVTQGIPTHPPVERSSVFERQSWSLLLLLCVAQFMVIVDITVVNVALPSIGKALHFSSAADLQWVVSAYVLVSGSLVLLGGRTADLLGRRRVFLTGLLLFTTASLASGLAPSPLPLMISRGFQGLGAALLTPAALSIITTTYSGAQRAVGLAAWGAIGAGGAAAGVLLGGALTSWLGWQWVFFINVPVGAVAAVFALRLVPAESARLRRWRELDIAGAVTLIAGLLLLVYAIQGAASNGWGSARMLIPFILSLGLLATFGVVERLVTGPMVPPSVWRLRSLVSSSAVMLGATAIMAGSFFLNSLYLQRVLGASPLEAGLAFLPFAAVIAVGAQLGSRLLPHLGARWVLVLGLITTAGGTLLLSRMPDHATYLANLLPGFVALGIGLGFSFMAVWITAMADVDSDHAGLASGLMTTGHEIGAALGVAIFSVIATMGAVQAGFPTGYRDGLLAAALLAGAVAALALLALPRVRLADSARARLHGG